MLNARIDLFAETLGMGTTIEVLLPAASDDPPVLYLLHGLSDDATSWLRRTSIERYAEARGLAVVMPQAGRSFYANEAHGLAYWDYVSEELPALVQRHLRVSAAPERTYVAGLSMGGYGALKLALRHPGRFRAAASLSGAVDVAAMAALATIPVAALDAIETEGFTARTIESAARTLNVQATQLMRFLGQRPGAEIRPEDGPQARQLLHVVVTELRRRRTMLTAIWDGQAPADTGDDLFALVADAAAETVPPLFLSCGTSDNLYEDNRRFAAHCLQHGLTLHREYHPGDHTWEFWDLHIQAALAWLPDLPAISL